MAFNAFTSDLGDFAGLTTEERERAFAQKIVFVGFPGAAAGERPELIITMGRDSTVLDLKRKLVNQYGGNINDVRVVARGRALNDTELLAESGFSRDGLWHAVYQRPRDGAE
jgi:hypothetical protein